MPHLDNRPHRVEQHCRSGLARAGHHPDMARPRAWAPLPRWPNSATSQCPAHLCRSSPIPSVRAATSLWGHGLCPKEEEGPIHDYLFSKLVDMSLAYLISIRFIYNSFILNTNSFFCSLSPKYISGLLSSCPSHIFSQCYHISSEIPEMSLLPINLATSISSPSELCFQQFLRSQDHRNKTYV
jgi:hypothetical protein